MSYGLINSLGLTLNLIGVILIFFYGISPMIDTDGNTYRITGEKDENEIRKARKYKCASRLGLILVIIGFIFQLLGTISPLI
jgi:hypothetical protein